MSNSVGTSEMEKFHGQKPGRAGGGGEKSNFAQTCSLLSQFLKEKGNFGDLSRGVSEMFETKGRSETFRPAVATMNLLPVMDRSAAGKPLDFFSQSGGVRSSDPVDDGFNKSDSGKPAMEPSETAPMTIFYAGKVIVYNDFPADKAMKIMAIASQGSSQNKNPTHSSLTTSNNLPCMVPATTTTGTNVAAVPTQTIGPADMPIARRKSLHRFLEKRKDRCTARAPYPVMNKSFGVSDKPQGSSSPAGMEAQPSEQLELKL